ncbi:hypothetical protein Hanom_Chr06g00525661 [Helianthus anomalus]
MVGMSSVPSGTERTGTENLQKWVPVPNIPGSVAVPVFEGKNRYRTGTVLDRYRYRTGTENIKNRYRKSTRFGKFGTGTGSVPVPGLISNGVELHPLGFFTNCGKIRFYC